MGDEEIHGSFEHGLGTMPELGDECVISMLDAGFERDLIQNLVSSIASIGEAIDRLPARIKLGFPATQPLPAALTRDFLMAHWEEVVGRPLLARFCANRTLRDLLAAFIVALQDGNVLVLALTARAALESSAAYDSLGQLFMGRKEKIEAQVLPFIRGKSSEGGPPVYDEGLVDELTRFQHGARLWSSGLSPKTAAEWKTWREDSQYVSEEEQKRGRDRSIATEIIDALKLRQVNVLTCIEKVSRRGRNMAALALYDMLSEFCHPNGDNRRIGVAESKLDGEQSIVEFLGTRSWTPGAIRGAALSMMAMTDAIDIHISGHNAIYDSAHELFLEIAGHSFVA